MTPLPCLKLPYATWGEISLAMRAMRREGRYRTCEAYRCPHCRHWHLGRPGRKKKRQRRKLREAKAGFKI